MVYLEAEGRAGYPFAISTDAQLTYSGLTIRSSAIPLGSCEEDGSILGRLVGSFARARPVAKTELARGAGVGFRPCCTKATRVSAPARYTFGGRPHEKARGLILWSTDGSWAARRYAARIYAKPPGSPPSFGVGRRNLPMSPPPRFLRT